MSRLLAIDPGNTESGWVVIDANTCQPLEFGKSNNHDLLEKVWGRAHTHDFIELDDPVFIEMVASYGMAVGKDVFETCVWIGRFAEACGRDSNGEGSQFVYRRPVKLHHCHSAKAKDSNIRQALVDRFAPGQPNYGKGTKAQPGWFYGFNADIWQAYALAVYAADTQLAPEGETL